MKRLELVYWYTLEFGLVEEGGSLRTYGAGVLSSFGEMERMTEEAELRPLDFADASTRPYDPTQVPARPLRLAVLGPDGRGRVGLAEDGLAPRP